MMDSPLFKCLISNFSGGGGGIASGPLEKLHLCHIQVSHILVTCLSFGLQNVARSGKCV